jgi:hypothetical protein
VFILVFATVAPAATESVLKHLPGRSDIAERVSNTFLKNAVPTEVAKIAKCA